MFNDALIYVYILLLFIFFVIFALFSEDEDDDGRDRKSGRDHETNRRIASAAEGSFILISLPLIAYILFFAILSLAILALGLMGHLHTHHISPYMSVF